MDWRDWELFCEVVEHGGFSAATRALGHPKSSLSAAVQRLEGHLGLRLIERTTRHLRLTDEGNTIYRRIKPLFSALHDTQSEALAMSGAVVGTLRIKSPYEFGAHHAGPVA
ncbi:MAG: LysR family transcriptional regulator, partial [Bradyrhizobium sp.]